MFVRIGTFEEGFKIKKMCFRLNNAIKKEYPLTIYKLAHTIPIIPVIL